MAMAFSYVRFSSKPQELGDSERRQLEGARKYCNANGHTLDESFKDLGVSAFRGKNKKAALGRFLSLVENGTIKKGSLLIVENMDRLARTEPLDAFEQFRSIIKSGIQIVSLMPEMVFSEKTIKENPWQLNMVITLMQIAHQSSDDKSKRVHEAWEEKRKTAATTKLTKQCPGWLVLDGNAFKFHPKKSQVVRKMIELGLKGYGLSKIAQAINRDHKGGFGRADELAPPVVHYVLRSRALIGEYQPKMRQGTQSVNAGEPIKGYYPSIIDDATFYRLQGILDARKMAWSTRVGKNGKTPQEAPNLFSGIVTCGNDSSTMFLTENNPGKKVLMNLAYKKGLEPCRVFAYDILEAEFLNWVTEIKLDQSSTENLQVKAIESTIVQLKSELAALKKKLDTDFSELLMDVAAKKERTLKAAFLELDKLKGVKANKGSVEAVGMLATDPLKRPQLQLAIAQLVKQIVVHIYRKAAGPTAVALVHVVFETGDSRVFAIKTSRKGNVGQELNVISIGWDEHYEAVDTHFLGELAETMVVAKGEDELADAYRNLIFFSKQARKNKHRAA